MRRPRASQTRTARAPWASQTRTTDELDAHCEQARRALRAHTCEPDAHREQARRAPRAGQTRTAGEPNMHRVRTR